MADIQDCKHSKRGIMEDLEALKARVRVLEEGHNRNRSRIEQNRNGVRTSLAMLVFAAIVWGVPIASVKWNDDEFHFTRDTTSPELVIIGGLVAASLFMGDKPMDLLKAIVNKR